MSETLSAPATPPAPPTVRLAVQNSWWVGIAIASINAMVSMLALDYLESVGSLRVCALISLILFGALLWRQQTNMLLLARTLVLGGVGYYAIIIKALFGATAMFSLYEFSTQGMDIVVRMYVATSLGLLGNEIGIAAGCRSAASRKARMRPPSARWRTVFWFSIPVIIVVSIVTARNTPTVFAAFYGTAGKEQLLGNTQNIGIICLLAAYVAMQKQQIRYGRTVFAAVAAIFLLWALLARGFRQDVVTAALGLAVCHGLVRGREVRIRPRNVAIILFFVAAMEFWGSARQVLAESGVGLAEAWRRFTSPDFHLGIYHLGTFSPIATTFANTVSLIDSHVLSPAHGRSYLEFIPRTLPAFMYPGRPADYALLFERYGLASAGGFFELAEGYMNFLFAGTLIFPAILSFLVTRAYHNALLRQNQISYFLLFSFLGMFMRGAWYQTFAYYKSGVTAMILLFACVVIHEIVADGRTARVVEATGAIA